MGSNIDSSRDNLAAAGDYILKQFGSYNLKVWEEDTLFDPMESKNIYGFKPGERKEILIIGAHYDSVQNTPGAVWVSWEPTLRKKFTPEKGKSFRHDLFGNVRDL